jgi:uncharacterized repeat protein (TIGR01451 family)
MGVGVGVEPNAVAAGANLTFTISVTNGGPDAATQAVMATAVPIGTTFVSLVSPAGWAATSATAVGRTGSISASIASLASGGQAVFTLTVRVAPSTASDLTIALTSSVSTTANDLNPADNSAGASATVSSELVATQTSLLSSANPAAFGRVVTLTATVTEATGGAPAGNVTFLDGTTPLKTVALDQHGHATFSTSSLGVGSHMITAVYGGNGTLAGSQSSINQVVQQPASEVGPQVTFVQRFGVHMHPTVLVLSFNMGLDPTSATNLENYELAGPGGKRIKFKSASYDSTAHTVTLLPTELVNVHRSYQLVVKGATPNGVCSVNHVLLDGAGAGNPGTDFVTTLTWKNAVLSPKNTSVLDKWLHSLRPRRR